MPETGSNDTAFMHEFQYCDSSLEKNKSDSYHLSIQAGLDGFSFSVLDPYLNKFLALSHFPFTSKTDLQYLPGIIKDRLNSQELLILEYNSISCILTGNKSTLLPGSLFNKEHIRSYFEFNHEMEDLDELHVNYLKYIDAYLIFSVYQELSNVLFRHFPKLKIFNQATPFIESTLVQKTNEQQLSVNFQSDFFDIIYLRGKQLILYNNFRYRDPRDVIYFILFTCDKLKLDPTVVPVCLSGDIAYQSIEAERIRQFFKNVSFARTDKQFSYPSGFNKLPEHTFLNLLNLYHCA
jgi:hypothetical protein